MPVHSFLSLPQESKDDYVKEVLRRVKRYDSIGYAGFSSKAGLKKHLEWNYWKQKDVGEAFRDAEAVRIAESTLQKCFRKLPPSGPMHCFLFRSSNKFIAQKMSGSTGFTTYKGAFVILINPKTRAWRTALQRTVAHEYHHAVYNRFYTRKTLLDSLVFEGVADTFQEDVVHGRSQWTRALGSKEVRKLFKRLKPKLRTDGKKLYADVFFGRKGYPVWGGYSLGYSIVGSYVKRNGRDWKRMVRMTPKEISKSWTADEKRSLSEW